MGEKVYIISEIYPTISSQSRTNGDNCISISIFHHGIMRWKIRIYWRNTYLPKYVCNYTNYHLQLSYISDTIIDFSHKSDIYVTHHAKQFHFNTYFYDKASSSGNPIVPSPLPYLTGKLKSRNRKPNGLRQYMDLAVVRVVLKYVRTNIYQIKMSDYIIVYTQRK